MLGYNRTITCTNINVLINIGPGAGEEGKEEVKKATFPTLLTMIVWPEDRVGFLRVLNSGDSTRPIFGYG